MNIPPGRKVSAHSFSPAFGSTQVPFGDCFQGSSAFLRPRAAPRSLPAVLVGGAGGFWGRAGAVGGALLISVAPGAVSCLGEE